MKRRDFVKILGVAPLIPTISFLNQPQPKISALNGFKEFLTSIKAKTPTSFEKHNLEFYSYYSQLFNAYNQYDKCLTVKFRQGGFTTFNLIHSAWEAMNNKNYHALHIVNNLTSIRFLMQHFNMLFPSIELNKNSSITFASNASDIRLNPDSKRFKQLPQQHTKIDRIYVDEAAWCNNIEDQLSNIKYKKLVLTSTLNTKEDYFYKAQQDNSFHVMKMNYKNCPKIVELVEKIRMHYYASDFEKEYLCEI